MHDEAILLGQVIDRNLASMKEAERMVTSFAAAAEDPDATPIEAIQIVRDFWKMIAARSCRRLEDAERHRDMLVLLVHQSHRN